MARNQRKPASVAPDDVRRKRLSDFLICLFLLLSTLAVYGQVRGFDFVNIDDREYITANAVVRAGMSSAGLAWALTADYAGNWFPVTWLSHMLDYQLFGLDSGLHHLTNVFIHAFGSLLLFLVLKRMTGARWRSAFVAFVFALHPLHVESVAWVTERKDVLSAFFFFLTLWAYVRYVEQPRFPRYLAVVVSFCLGIMSKARVVTLPFVLLLLDIWPLRRFMMGTPATVTRPKQKSPAGFDRKPGFARILLEKAPLFALSAVTAVITIVVQRRGGAIVTLDYIPMGTRLANSLISYMTYIIKMLWPTGLAVFYPQPPTLSTWQVLASGLTLAGISLLVLRLFKISPYLTVGWLWYLGTLVPVIGLVQVGMQTHADRYAYLPSVGILIMIAWGVTDLARLRAQAKSALAGAVILATAGCAILTLHQVRFWQNSLTLFQHALEVTADNHVAHNGLGIALQEQGRLEEAISHYREAIRLRPHYPEARASLGAALLRLGRTDEAIRQLSETIRMSPMHLEAHIDLGIAYDTLDKEDEAIAPLLEAIKIEPNSANAHYNLGRVYTKAGRIVEAVTQFSLATRLQPDNSEAHYNLGVTLAAKGDMDAAVAEFIKAIQIRPDYGAAHNNLGSALASLGRIDEAILHFQEALRLMPDSEEARLNLEYALSLKKH